MAEVISDPLIDEKKKTVLPKPYLFCTAFDGKTAVFEFRHRFFENGRVRERVAKKISVSVADTDTPEDVMTKAKGIIASWSKSAEEMEDFRQKINNAKQ